MTRDDGHADTMNRDTMRTCNYVDVAVDGICRDACAKALLRACPDIEHVHVPWTGRMGAWEKYDYDHIGDIMVSRNSGAMSHEANLQRFSTAAENMMVDATVHMARNTQLVGARTVMLCAVSRFFCNSVRDDLRVVLYMVAAPCDAQTAEAKFGPPVVTRLLEGAAAAAPSQHQEPRRARASTMTETRTDEVDADTQTIIDYVYDAVDRVARAVCVDALPRFLPNAERVYFRSVSEPRDEESLENIGVIMVSKEVSKHASTHEGYQKARLFIEHAERKMADTVERIAHNYGLQNAHTLVLTTSVFMFIPPMADHVCVSIDMMIRPCDARTAEAEYDAPFVIQRFRGDAAAAAPESPQRLEAPPRPPASPRQLEEPPRVDPTAHRAAAEAATASPPDPRAAADAAAAAAAAAAAVAVGAPRAAKRASSALNEISEAASLQWETCAVCMDRDADTACVPCGHLATCCTCALKIKRTANNLCPICRARVASWMQIRPQGVARSFCGGGGGSDGGGAGGGGGGGGARADTSELVACARCTYANPGDARACEMCEGALSPGGGGGGGGRMSPMLTAALAESQRTAAAAAAVFHPAAYDTAPRSAQDEPQRPAYVDQGPGLRLYLRLLENKRAAVQDELRRSQNIDYSAALQRHTECIDRFQQVLRNELSNNEWILADRNHVGAVELITTRHEVRRAKHAEASAECKARATAPGNYLISERHHDWLRADALRDREDGPGALNYMLKTVAGDSPMLVEFIGRHNGKPQPSRRRFIQKYIRATTDAERIALVRASDRSALAARSRMLLNAAREQQLREDEDLALA
jgi:hypothetical protein